MIARGSLVPLRRQLKEGVGLLRKATAYLPEGHPMKEKADDYLERYRLSLDG